MTCCEPLRPMTMPTIPNTPNLAFKFQISQPLLPLTPCPMELWESIEDVLFFLGVKRTLSLIFFSNIWITFFGETIVGHLQS